jgi:predicted TIM-barrel fold metal-dependent hydrolase
MERFSVVDADGHITESDEALAPYLEESFRQKSRPFFPRVNWDFHMQGRLAPYRAPDAENWLKAMDKEGIETAVLFPTAGLSIGLVRQPDLAQALCRAYNDFVHERFMKASKRLKPVAIIPLQDIPAAVKELNRVATQLGLRCAMLPAYGLRQPLGRPEYWPIYEEAERLDIALAVHASPGGSEQLGTHLFDQLIQVHTLCHPFGQMAQLTSIICGGIPEKFPKLRLGFMEAGCGWVVYLMERLDEEYEKRAEEAPLLKGKPSEYMRSGRLFYSCESEEGMLPYVLDRMGEGVILFSSDFPHWDCRYPNAVKTIMNRTDLSVEQMKKVLGENARRFYRLD